jgi:ribonuclease Z
MFSAALVNDPFGDPAVYIEFKYRNEAILFDLGDLHLLPPRKILKISHVFVSHTHMDHFIGFDQMLRVCLGRDLHIALFGPPGFLEHIENKLRAYTWNLVENYTNDFALLATEVHERELVVKRYHCRTAFAPELIETRRHNGILMENKLFAVSGVFLDHKIPCLAFRFEEKDRVNIKKTALDVMGLPTGAWLMNLREHVLSGAPDDTPVRVWWRNEDRQIVERHYPLGELRESIVRITPGQRIAYVTDAIYSDENNRRIVDLAGRADHLFIESTFSNEDSGKASEKYHLTAFQAGSLARLAGAKRITPFHFSPKYKKCGQLLIDEAMNAFSGS